MRTGLSFVLVAVLALSTLQGIDAGSSGTCAGCTIVVGLVERMALNLGVPVASAVKNLCTDLSPKVDWIASLCSDVLQLFVPEIEADFKAGKNPDWTCINTLALCKDFPTCNLYKVWPPPDPTSNGGRSVEKVKKSYADTLSTVGMVMAAQAMMFPANPPVPTGDVVDHLPLIDLDNDYFSTIPTLRGIHWRGRDCNDLDATIYPGRSKNTHQPAVDHNCNGIKGTDASGVAYEDKFCKGTGQLGVIALGDSATAHFHIPPDWLNALTMDNTTWANLIPYAEDELDFPQCSSSVGFESNENCPESDLPVDSLYLRLRERNLCNHRDYQNVGVNGGSSNNMQPPNGIIVSMKARNGTDQPALVIYALIGNDVCGHHADFDHMTTPDQFEKNTLNSLAYLDAHLPAGSHVVLVGLVDGRVLFNTMAEEQHPAGVTYETLYDYLNCLDTSPCWGWMNSNETVRNKTSEIAASLNLRYPKIMKEHTYKNFDMHYIDSVTMMNEVIAEWVKEGHDPVDLIEPADGFHPSQTTNALFASNIWNDLATNVPTFIGSVNPNNAAIKAQFGDQGGYYTDS